MKQPAAFLKNRFKLTELAKLQKTEADLTPEEAERLAAHCRKKADQQKARRERKKAELPGEKVS
ncbi:hypothetical protein AALA00_12440 [Lachnospiraceae bacterium 46-15]